jgi:CRP/FNR family transcriptional regulator, nitrogen fixation regulation protein
MLTQTAIRSDAFNRPVPPTRNIPPAATKGFGGASERKPLGQSIYLMGAAKSYPRNAEIYGENEPAEYLYKVISGAVRTYKILSDGRRQIGGFYLPGDIFGLEFADEHTLSAEAIADANVLVIKRSMLTVLAARDAGVARELFALTGCEVQRMQERVLLLIKTAQERVVGFLLEMAERVPAGNAIELPMSRQDIADYLGLTIETVSRTLTSLEDSAAIDVPTSRRRIVLRNRTALSHMNA